MTSHQTERTSASGSRAQTLASAERIVRVNGVDLCLQTFGDSADPAILLIQGTGGSMLWWEDEFCERLAAGSRFVIRYDNRDTGRSVTYPPGAPGYTFRDMVEDAAGVLDAVGLGSAHIAAISMGGGIAHQLVIEHPERVESLTLIATSPGSPDLPPTSDRYRAHLQRAVPPDWSDQAAVIDYIVAETRALAAPSRPFDEAEARAFVRRDVERAVNMESTENHAKMASGDLSPAPPEPIRTPSLVIHGTEDPLFSLPHAHAMVQEFPGAHLITLEQMGHELPRNVWDEVIPAIVQHTATGGDVS